MRGSLIALAMAATASLMAAPNQRRYEYEDVRASFGDIQHVVGNQQVEIKIFEERLGTLDVTLEAIRNEIFSLKQAQKEKASVSSRDLDLRIGTLDLTAKSAVADIKALKGQVNDTASAFGAVKERLTALEKLVEGQNQNIDALQAAMRALAEAVQPKESVKGTKAYVIKSGDALEKIARSHQMTIEEIKELNGLTGTKIIIGQKLLVYDR